jgi:N-acetylneuraminic acid mutarotase
MRVVFKMCRDLFALMVLGVVLSACNSQPTTLTPRRAFAAELFNERVYAIGGWNGQATQLNVVEILDPQTFQAQSAPSLNIARSQHASVVADNAIWVIGGWSAERGLVSAVEVFSPRENAWRIATHLPTPRREPAAVLLGRRIVVGGGFDGINDGDVDGYLDTVEAYDLDTQQWYTLARLHSPRRGLTMVAFEHKLYAIGGYVAGDGYLNTVERYNADRDVWQTLDWKIAARTWAATVVADNSIVILGGFNRAGFLGLVERVDPRAGRICHPAPMRVPRSWFAAVSVGNCILTLGGEEADGIKNTIEWVNPKCANRIRNTQ